MKTRAQKGYCAIRKHKQSTNLFMACLSVGVIDQMQQIMALPDYDARYQYASSMIPEAMLNLTIAFWSCWKSDTKEVTDDTPPELQLVCETPDEKRAFRECFVVLHDRYRDINIEPDADFTAFRAYCVRYLKRNAAPETTTPPPHTQGL